MVIKDKNNLEESMLLKISVRICPSFWYQMALSRVLAHGASHQLGFSTSFCLIYNICLLISVPTINTAVLNNLTLKESDLLILFFVCLLL